MFGEPRREAPLRPMVRSLSSPVKARNSTLRRAHAIENDEIVAKSVTALISGWVSLDAQ
jgi:hypothetical protein